MSPEVLTAIIGGAALILAPLLTQGWIERRKRSRSDSVSALAGYEALTKDINRDRDRAIARADKQEAEHRAEMAAMQQRHAQEMTQVRAELEACKAQLQQVYAEVYRLRQQTNT